MKHSIPTRGYAVCTQPRSGSNLLCEYLASTDQLGYPLEYFNGSARRALGIPDFPDDPHQQIDFVLRRAATTNGIYALKLFPHQHDSISASLRWTELLPNLRFVYLERRDLLAQAISWAKALQTSQYRSTQVPQCVPIYDGHAILDRLLAIVRERARWEIFFARTGILPLRIVYEEFVDDPLRHVNRIAEFMDIREQTVVDPSRVSLTIQRNTLSDAWRQQFLAEFGDPNRIDVI